MFVPKKRGEEKAEAAGTSGLSEPGDVCPAVNRTSRPVFLCMASGFEAVSAVTSVRLAAGWSCFFFLAAGKGLKVVVCGGPGAPSAYCVGMGG